MGAFPISTAVVCAVHVSFIVCFLIIHVVCPKLITSITTMTSTNTSKLERVKSHLVSHQDFPKPGVCFRDIFPVLRSPSVAADLYDLLYDAAREVKGVECVVGLESRGFIFGPILAQRLGVSFVPVRKKGKLPGEVVSISYSLEYGKDVFEVQKDSISRGQKVLILDDLLATGGTMKAAADLMDKLGADTVGCLVVVELAGLQGRGRIGKPLTSLLQY